METGYRVHFHHYFNGAKVTRSFFSEHLKVTNVTIQRQRTCTYVVKKMTLVFEKKNNRGTDFKSDAGAVTEQIICFLLDTKKELGTSLTG